MAPDFLTQANWGRDDAQAIAADRLSINLSEAERALQELADVFLQQQSLISSTSLEFREAARIEASVRKLLVQHGSEIPRTRRANSRCRVHGLSRQGNRRSLRKPADRSGAGFFAERMAGRPGALVSADSSRRQDAMERGSCRDVPLRQTVAIRVPGHRARWKSALVSVRSEDDSPGRWTAMVYPRRWIRHYRAQGSRGSDSGNQREGTTAHRSGFA